MKDGKQRVKPDTGVPSGRGTYAKQACSHCRKRKSKCDGRAPVCGPCEKAGRAAECTWGKETAKKARTQQHFESLENYIRALEAKVKDLQADLEHCRQNHGGPSPAPSSDAGLHASTSLLPRRESSEPEIPTDDEGHTTTTSDSDIEHLISPTRHLLLQDTDLEYHGPTSVWRLGAAQRSSPAASEAKSSASPEPQPAAPTTYFDWSRHLPPEIPLSRPEHDRLLEILCKFHMSWGLRMIPELYLRDMLRALSLPPNAPQPKSAHYSPMLHNAALALAMSFSDDPALNNLRTKRAFSTRAKSYIDADCQKPTIATVTAFTTLAIFHSTCGEQSLGYLYMGMAGRITQALGLKTECSSWVNKGIISQADMLDRNWAYWTVYSQDILWSLYVGRECCIFPHKERPFPVPYIGSELDTAQWYWAPSKMPPQPSYIVRTFEQSCELMIIGRRVFEFLNSLGPGSKREGALQQVSELDIQLNNWKDGLTPEVDLTAASRPNALPHRLMLHLVYWWTLLLLHRPFYRRTRVGNSGPEIDHVKLCNRASDNIMLLLGIWSEKYTLRYLPVTLLQVIYCAGTSYILSAVQATSGPRLGRVALNTALSHAEQCIRYLLVAGKSYDCANEIASILSNLLYDQLQPRLLARTLEPKDVLPPAPLPGSAQDRDQVQRQNQNNMTNGSSSEAAADALSLATTLSNLDTLRDQCRFQVAANSQQSPVSWGASVRTGLSLFPVSQLPSSSTASTSSPISQFGTYPFDRDAGQSQNQNQSQSLTRLPEDIDMDYGLGGIDLSMMTGQPISNRPYMSFGIPELVGGFPDIDAPPFDPQLHSGTPSGQQQMQRNQGQGQGQPQPGQVQGGGGPLSQSMHLDFSADELAVMDQILRQQFAQGLDYGMHPSQSRYNPLQ